MGDSEGHEFVPQPQEPAFALAVGDDAFGTILDGGVGDLVAEDAVGSGDVFDADRAAEDGVGGFAGDFGLALAFDEEGVIGQGVDDADGEAGGDAFGVVDLAAAVEGGLSGEVYGGQLAAFGEEAAGSGAVEEAVDGGVDGRLFGCFGVVLF
jgi:hypothetical protein